jgi:DNA-binding NtrC family response regulator
LEVAKAAVIPKATDITDVRGHERVLIVDDDADLRDVLTVGLERLGYEVVAVGDPQEALEAVTEDPTAWDIVISDEVMPVMRGISLLRHFKALRATAGFILYTGFGGSVTEEVAWNAGVDEFFIKPVSVHQLAAAIRRIRDANQRAARRAGS